MLKMKKEMLAISISLVLSLISISGCIEETSQVGEPNIVEKLKIVFVDDDGGANFTKIQDAIDHVAVGGTVFVSNGTYYEMLIIDKSINLIGANMDKTIIDYKVGLSSSDSVFLINADNCNVKGFNISYLNSTSNINSIGIKIRSSNNTISNNIIMSNYKGVYLDTYSKNNTISGNTISYAKYGIDTHRSEGNNISRNNISSCTSYGMYLFSSDSNILSDNIISDNSYGIRIKGSKNNKLFGNTVTTNEYGIYLCCGAKYNVVYYNILKQNSWYNARDDVDNQWDNGSVGNYWDDYTEKHPDARQIDGIWDTPYNITGGDNMDRFPLINPVDI